MAETTHPEVLWTQRSSTTEPAKNYISLTIMAPDIKPENLTLDLTPTKLNFKGHSDTKGVTYAVEMEFYGEVDVEGSKAHHTARDIVYIIRKKELKQEYWPRLLKDKARVHYLKTDFDKWVDEDEQDEAPDDDFANQYGGDMGEGGMGGIDFSKLGGGAGGMPDMSAFSGMGGAGGDDFGEEEEDDDEEMPELKDGTEPTPVAAAPHEHKEAEAAAHPKIEEVS
jgi:hypothetical protein